MLLYGVTFAPRRWALLSMVVGCLYLTFGGGFTVAGFSLQPTRILGYFCFLRVWKRKEFSVPQLTRTDKSLLVLYIFTTLVLLVRQPESAALWCAKFFDVILTYFAFRGLLRSPDEFKWLLRSIVALLFPYVLILAVEYTKGINLFDFVGAGGQIWSRDGEVRCFGSFRHPSLLGSLGACFFPLYLGLAWYTEVRQRAILGAFLCLLIVVFSHSGGPTSVLAVGIVGWLLWPMRRKMSLFRRGLACLIVVLALIMKAPVWYLLARVSALTGGSGWHRSYLIDVAFQHLNEWWLVGMREEDTASWFPYSLEATGGADITNQFLGFGTNAGLLAMALFIFLIYSGFSKVGHALGFVRESSNIRKYEPLLWALGVVLASHVSNWLGISYFDQFNVLWLLQLAALVSLSEYCLLQPDSIQNHEHIVIPESEIAFAPSPNIGLSDTE